MIAHDVISSPFSFHWSPFALNPQYFDPDNIVKPTIEGRYYAVASTFDVLGVVARKYAHKIPFIVKIDHNELFTSPNNRVCLAQ